MNRLRFLNKKIKYLKPPNTQAEIALFDATNSEPFLQALRDFRIFVIPTRGEYYYFSFGILWSMLCILFVKILEENWRFSELKRALRFSYFGAVIKQSQCKVVVSYIDNAEFYHGLSHEVIDLPFLTFQNGSRYPYGVDSHRLPIKNFFCFGQHEIDLYRQSKQSVENFVCFGLLTTLNFLASHPPPCTNEFDVFYPSQFHDNIQYGALMPWEKAGQLRVVALLKAILAARPSMTVLIGLRSTDQLEKDYYLRALEDNPRVLFAEKTGTYSSYEAARRCRLVLGFTSTLVEEAMSWGQKAIYVHLSPDPGCFFFNPHWQKCMIQGTLEEDAIAAVLEVLDMPMEDYQKTTIAERSYMMETDRPHERIMILRKFFREVVDRGVRAGELEDVLQHYFVKIENHIWRLR